MNTSNIIYSVVRLSFVVGMYVFGLAFLIGIGIDFVLSIFKNIVK